MHTLTPHSNIVNTVGIIYINLREHSHVHMGLYIWADGVSAGAVVHSVRYWPTIAHMCIGLAFAKLN